MSLVIAPEIVTAAVGELADIHASLGAATAAATAPTTRLAAAAADEISAAVSGVFGAYGLEFQAVTAQAAAFHDEFVSFLNGGVAAYLGTEIANAEQAQINAINAPAQALLGHPPLLAGQIAAEVQAVSRTPALMGNSPTATRTAAADSAYQQLFADTQANLQSFKTTFAANPFPFLSQVIANQQVYGQTISTSLAAAIQNLPAGLANVPANIQAWSVFNPAPALQQFVNNQNAYAQIVNSSLQNAGQDFGTAASALPAAYQAAFQDLMAGDISDAASGLAKAYLNLVFTGFVTQKVSVMMFFTTTYAISLSGPVPDLFPILSIPGLEAQTVANLLPAGSVSAQIAQNFANVLDTLPDTSITSVVTISLIKQSMTNTFGLPLAVALQAAGSPLTTLSALGTSATTFADAVQAGNGQSAVGALADAPAVVADGFLNGQMTVPLIINASGQQVQLNLPFSGILVPQAPYTAILPIGAGKTIVVGGTQLGGIIPALYAASGQLANAIKPA